MSEVDRLARRFQVSAADQRTRSPFNARLCASIADTPDIASLLDAAPDEQQLPVLLLAAVHSIVLAEPNIALAAWYPTVTPAPRDDDPFPAFAELCRERHGEIRDLIARRSTQTNEVARCALYLPALGVLADEVGPVGLVDIGTSAGLNLQLDRFQYRYEPAGVVGNPSPVTLHCSIRGPAPIPAALPLITDRLGIDRHPIDLADADSVRWLKACVWPDQADRFQRLTNAIALAIDRPSPVMAGDAVRNLAAGVTRVGQTSHPTVLTSWVLNYLTQAGRTEFVGELDRIGATRDLSWVVLECPGMCEGLPFPGDISASLLTHLLLIRWRHGVRTVEHLAACHPHGYWLHWAAPACE